jgi:Raf kinase inhibitor-like YbhB/YbcL family protein
MEMKITSQAFEDEGMIPEKYTCDDINVSPPLAWSPGPEGTRTYALICDDPDAPMGTWVHWVLFNLPVNINELPEGIPPERDLESEAKQGMNDFRKIGYGGPCPPGGTHRYFFKLYALDAEVDLESGATKSDLLRAMEGHILAESQLMGKYQR